MEINWPWKETAALLFDFLVSITDLLLNIAIVWWPITVMGLLAIGIKILMVMQQRFI